MADLHVIGTDATDAKAKQEMLEAVEILRVMVETGEIASLIVIPIRRDFDFHVMSKSSLRRLQIVSYLAQAQHDLLSKE